MPLKKAVAILCAVMLVILLPSCAEKPEQTEIIEEKPPTAAEPVPNPPTAAEAARHNGAIDSGRIRLIQFEEPEPGDTLAVIVTTAGDITVRLFQTQAPETVRAFIELAEEGHYDGSSFAGSVDGYKIDGAGKADNAVFPEEEFSLDLWNFHGAVSVSNNGSNFMIVTANYPLNAKVELEELKFPEPVLQKYLAIGGAPHQDWKNTVFGQVIAGMDTAEQIAAASGGESVQILEIEINEY